jgi:hypothetical protein
MLAQMRLADASTVVHSVVMTDETQEPTLRMGDSSSDGWVEYLQDLLSNHLVSAGGTALVNDGDFGNATHEAVVWFQQANGLLVDGVVGNQTWAALRGEEPQAIGTDGREAHSFVDAGYEARWYHETAAAMYDPNADVISITACNTGTDPINSGNLVSFIVVTSASGNSSEVSTSFQNRSGADGDALAGEDFWLVLREIRSNFGEGDLSVTAEMGAEFGGDILQTTVNVPEQ